MGRVAAAEGTQGHADAPRRHDAWPPGLGRGNDVAEGKPERHPRCHGGAPSDPVLVEAGRGQEGDSEKPWEGLTLSCWL